MFCKSCGNKMEYGALYCQFCGNAVEKSGTINETIHVSHVNKPTTVDCKHCNGTGTCDGDRGIISCITCRKIAQQKYNLSYDETIVDKVECSFCKGKGYHIE